MDNKNARLKSIDAVRGLVMVTMAWDHSLYFLSNFQFDPLNINETSVVAFLSKWIGHISAPAFILLAGISIYLKKSKIKNISQLSKFLILRGLVLILIDLFFFSYVWDFHGHYFTLGILWAIGWFMVIMGFLIYLPPKFLVLISTIIICFSFLLSNRITSFPSAFSHIFYGNTYFNAFGFRFFTGYSLFPWIALIFLGYGLGPLFLQPGEIRRKNLTNIGLLIFISFLILRFLNSFGDPKPWLIQNNFLYTLLSFLNCTKKPASLMFLLMTLSMVFVLIAYFESEVKDKAFGKFFITFGRVSLFFYLIHAPLLLLIALGLAYINYQTLKIRNFQLYGYSLPAVFGFFILVLVVSFFLCFWYGKIKAKNPKNSLLKYF